MSYQVLARKWRPRSFETLVGQQHVVRALTHALQHGRLHHAYLFTGTRGVGKTTIARILAKSLNCEHGVSATPCGICSACQEIDAGRFVDLIEVDAATNTRVDEMRQLLENAVYAPTRGRYKVYVIDEVHMLSNAAFNAMLKTLEEPPDHVKFILATTDPQKIPVTVLSRCLQFNLKQMPLGSIVEHLSSLLKEEDVFAEVEALRLIARAANGSMRDALSLLDQAIAYGAGDVKSESVTAMLGTLGNEHLYEIIDALIEANPVGLKRVVENLAARSISYDVALTALADLWVEIQAFQFHCSGIAEHAVSFQRCRDFSEHLSVEFVQLAYTITLQGRAQLPLAPSPEAGFLMTLLRLFAFRPNDRLAAEKKNLVSDSVPVATSRLPLGSLESTVDNGEERSSPISAPAVGVAKPPRESVTNWTLTLARLNLAGLARELASHCELIAQASSTITLKLSPVHRHLLSKASQEKLQTALCEKTGVRNLEIILGEPISETPAQQTSRLRSIEQEDAVAAIEGDSVVRDLVKSLDASIIESSIRASVS